MNNFLNILEKTIEHMYDTNSAKNIKFLQDSHQLEKYMLDLYMFHNNLNDALKHPYFKFVYWLHKRNEKYE